MKPASVYQALHDAGLHVRIDADKLIIGPAELLTDDLRRLIRDHRPGLVSFITEAQRLTDQLLAAAMRACDHHGDSPAAREQMRADCLATPPGQRADLLDHFNTQYPKES